MGRWVLLLQNDVLAPSQLLILYPVSCILYPVSFILYPVSCILYPLSCILYPVSFILYPVSFILYPLYCILYPLSCIFYPVSCILYRGVVVGLTQVTLITLIMGLLPSCPWAELLDIKRSTPTMSDTCVYPIMSPL